MLSSADAFSLMRYSYPFIIGAAYFAFAAVSSTRLKLTPRLELAICAVGLAVMIFHVALLLARQPTESARDQAYDARIVAYRAAQAQVPPGEKILVFSAGPFGFDIDRK